jgi:hypothetical protein
VNGGRGMEWVKYKAVRVQVENEKNLTILVVLSKHVIFPSLKTRREINSESHTIRCKSQVLQTFKFIHLLITPF